MGRSRANDGTGSFPSSSSSEFEFTVTTLSPGSKQRCPADDLFYKGQLLPLHLSPRISMVRTLLLASPSSSSSTRDSDGSTSSSFSADCAADSAPSSSRPSSADDDRHLLRGGAAGLLPPATKRTGKQYLSSFATRFSSVFLHRGGGAAKEVIKKYAKKVKPLYSKLSQITTVSNQQPPPVPAQQQSLKKPFTFSIRKKRAADEEDHAIAVAVAATEVGGKYAHSNSFSGNLRLPRQKWWAASCPSSTRSSPSHSGLLSFGGAGFPDVPAAMSSMEELQGAIEGAIAHCKDTMGGAAAVSLCPRASGHSERAAGRVH